MASNPKVSKSDECRAEDLQLNSLSMSRFVLPRSEAPKSTVTVKPGSRGGPPGARSGPTGSPHDPRGPPAPRGIPRGGPAIPPQRPGPHRSPEKKKPAGGPPGHLLPPVAPPGSKAGVPPVVGKPGLLQERGRPRERDPPSRAL